MPTTEILQDSKESRIARAQQLFRAARTPAEQEAARDAYMLEVHGAGYRAQQMAARAATLRAEEQGPLMLEARRVELAQVERDIRDINADIDRLREESFRLQALLAGIRRAQSILSM